MIEALDAATKQGDNADGLLTEEDTDRFEALAEQNHLTTRQRNATEEEISLQDKRYPPLPGGQGAMTREAAAAVEEADMEAMVAELSADDRAAFRAFEARDAAAQAHAEEEETSWGRRSLAHRVTMPESGNPTYYFGVKTDYNDSQLTEWRCVTWTAAILSYPMLPG